jgi:hypothetical protein
MFSIQLIQTTVDFERKLEMENEDRKNRQAESCVDCSSTSQSPSKKA